ncbi:MAG: hypothetical protein QM690_15500 [Sphingobium sp.]
MARFLFLSSLLLLSSASVSAAPASSASAFAAEAPTIVRDRAAMARLLGNEGITLQWIDWDRRGELDARMPGATLYLEGSQRAASGPGLLTLSGRVTEVDADRFRFHGRIVITGTPDAGRQCVRDGDFTFAITQNRRYWRLQEMERCDGLTDYVDIYF